MTNTVSKTMTPSKTKFTPDLENFKVSLSYEGLTLKKGSERKSIQDLKRKYAR